MEQDSSITILSLLPCQKCSVEGPKTAKCNWCGLYFCTYEYALPHINTCSLRDDKPNKCTNQQRSTYNPHVCASKLHSIGIPFDATVYCNGCKLYLCRHCARCQNHAS